MDNETRGIRETAARATARVAAPVLTFVAILLGIGIVVAIQVAILGLIFAIFALSIFFGIASGVFGEARVRRALSRMGIDAEFTPGEDDTADAKERTR